MRVPTVEIEFTEDTFHPDGSVQRDKGERAYVDKTSAHSFCDVKKVARRVADGPVMTTTKRAPRKKRGDTTSEDDVESDGA